MLHMQMGVCLYTHRHRHRDTHIHMYMLSFWAPLSDSMSTATALANILGVSRVSCIVLQVPLSTQL